MTVPEGTDLQKIVSAAVDSAGGHRRPHRADSVAAGRAAGLRRAAAASEPGELDGERLMLTVEIHSLSAVGGCCSAPRRWVVLDPPELRDLVVAALDRLAGVSA